MRKLLSFVGVVLMLIHPFGSMIFAYEGVPDPEYEQQESTMQDQFTDDAESIQEDETFGSDENIDDTGENLVEEDSIVPEEPFVDTLNDEDLDDPLPDNPLLEEEEIQDEEIVQEDQEIQEPAEEQEETDPSQDITQTPLLLITEVYFAGTDERFELYNPHDTVFIGNIQLSGVKSSILHINNLTIPPHTARIFGDNMAMISNSTVIERAGLALNMVDTVPIAITLLHNDIILDTFTASLAMMNASKPSNGPRASLQKLLNDYNTTHISPIIQNYNHSDGFTINPGIVYGSIDQEAPSACATRGSTIQITEIFWGDEERAPYIEIFSPQSINQTITIGGTQILTPLDITINQPGGHYHLLVSTADGYPLHPYRSDNQELSIGYELGNIIIYGQSGQVLDTVDIQVREDGYSTYISGQGCTRVGDIVQVYSPGFSENYLSYFPEGVENLITVTQQILIPSGGSCQSDTETGQIEAIATGDYVMEIAYIDYDPPGSDTNRESIVLHSLVDYPLDLSVYSLRLSTRNGLQYLRGVLEPEEELTLTGNFRFPNAGACVDLLYGDFIVDSYCYPLAGSGSGEIENDYSDLSITIDHLNYDPPGDDTNNEEITFTVHSGVLDFSHGFYVLINGRKYNLTPFAGPRTGTFVLKANYRMPNSQDACVSLLYQDFVFDTKCYSVNQNSSSSSSTQINTERFSHTIRINHIDYDPPGSDTNNEKITLIMDQGSAVDLSQFHILINGTKKKLKETLSPGTPLTLIGTYGFPNTKQTCVVLQYQSHVYDTYCYDPAEDSKKAQDASIWSGTIQINSILYDPPGNDSNREEIHLSIDGPAIDFSQGWHLLVNTSKKSLQKYGTINSGSIVLTGTFSFPNTKDTCVSIRQHQTQFDEYCYQIGGPQEPSAGYSGVSLAILAVLPNPRGADVGKERVEVSLKHPQKVDLSQGFSLIINGSKKKLSGTISGSDPYRITGSFALPNAASCISLLYNDTLLDTFCYPQSKEGIIYSKNAHTMLALTDAELALLKNTALTRIDNKICLTLSEVSIKCRAVPAGKLAARQFQELQLSRNYITMLHDYLYNHRQLLYFNSDISKYKTLFDASKKDISASQFTRKYGSERIPIADIQTRFQLQYQQPLLQQVQGQVISKIFGPKLTQNYNKAKERYYTRR